MLCLSIFRSRSKFIVRNFFDFDNNFLTFLTFFLAYLTFFFFWLFFLIEIVMTFWHFFTSFTSRFTYSCIYNLMLASERCNIPFHKLVIGSKYFFNIVDTWYPGHSLFPNFFPVPRILLCNLTNICIIFVLFFVKQKNGILRKKPNETTNESKKSLHMKL